MFGQLPLWGGGPQEGVEMRLGEGLQTLGAMGCRKGLFEKVLMPAMIYAAETGRMKKGEIFGID